MYISSQPIFPEIWKRKYVIRNPVFHLLFILGFYVEMHFLSFQMSVFTINMFAIIYVHSSLESQNCVHHYRKKTLNPVLKHVDLPNLKKKSLLFVEPFRVLILFLSFHKFIRLVCCLY